MAFLFFMTFGFKSEDCLKLLELGVLALSLSPSHCVPTVVKQPLASQPASQPAGYIPVTIEDANVRST